ncbi:MAG: tetratricopeptide (TPR) repeat protein [Rhodothermales bacterium]
MSNLEQRFEETASWYDDLTIQYPRSLIAVWSLTVDRLSPAAGELLDALAWFAPEPIPEFVLEDVIDQKNELVDCSLLRWENDGAVQMHRLLQEVTQALQSQGARVPLEAALERLKSATSAHPMNVDDWQVWRPLRPHLEAATQFGDKFRIGEPTGYLMNELGMFLQASGDFEHASGWLARATEIAESGGGVDLLETAKRLNNLGDLLRTLDRLEEAETFCRRALDLTNELSGSFDEEAIFLNNLALACQFQGKFEEAEPLFWRALAMNSCRLGELSAAVGTDLSNLGLLLLQTRRLEEAEDALNQAMEISEREHGPHAPAVARALNNLAGVYHGLNRLPEAIAAMEQVVRITEQAFGEAHPDLGLNLFNLAGVLWNSGSPDEAEPKMFRAACILHAAFGPAHSNTEHVFEKYLELLSELGWHEAQITERMTQTVRGAEQGAR